MSSCETSRIFIKLASTFYFPCKLYKIWEGFWRTRRMTILKTKRTCDCSSRSYIPDMLCFYLICLWLCENLSFYIKEWLRQLWSSLMILEMMVFNFFLLMNTMLNFNIKWMCSLRHCVCTLESNRSLKLSCNGITWQFQNRSLFICTLINIKKCNTTPKCIDRPSNSNSIGN